MTRLRTLPLLLLLLFVLPARADYNLDWEASTTAAAATGDFLPTFITNNRAGLLIDGRTLQEQASLKRKLSTDTRFSYGFGANVALTASSAVGYERFFESPADPGSGVLEDVNRRPAWVRVQELYGEVKYRGVYLFAGMKENDRSIFGNPLESGDLTLSNNARPIPQVRVGFIDFQNIPFTRGWVQIQGDIAYGKFADNGWLRQHYNYFDYFLTTGTWYHYKRCYFRTKPSQPFSITVGMQHAAQFAGTYTIYRDGQLYLTQHDKVTLKQLLKIFYQPKGNDSSIDAESINFIGNHLGSWDVRMRYRLRNNDEITFYMQKPWEDESGVAWQTGFDGVWGLEYTAAEPWWIDGAVVEYQDFTNQGGPILWDLRDHPSTIIAEPGKATGADDYYNNFMYNGWANYGQSIGSPIFKAPVYNTDGYLRFTDNHLRGIHVGLSGAILPLEGLCWRLLGRYQQSNGTPLVPRFNTDHVTSLSLQADWKLPSVKGLTLTAQFAFDSGSLYQPTYGAMLRATYCGVLTFKRK